MPDQQPPLYLQPEVSRQLIAFLLITHLLALGVILFMPFLPWWGKALSLLVVAYSGWYYWRLHILRSLPQSVLDVHFYATDNCLVHAQADSVFAVLDNSSFLHPWLCVLNLRSRNGKLYTLILPNDSLSTDILRQLRVRVKFAADSR